jgi:hypothetical protein
MAIEQDKAVKLEAELKNSKLEQQLKKEIKKTQAINEKAQEIKIKIEKVPEASTDGSGTDKFLADLAKPEKKDQKPMPIHLKITTNGGKVEGVEQMNASQSQSLSSDSSTIKLPPIEVPVQKNEEGKPMINIKLNNQSF